MKVDNLMTPRVVSIHLDDSLAQVHDIFKNTHFHHLLVVENRRLRGVVSDRDLFKALSPHIGTPGETLRDRATLNKRVHQIMSRNPITLETGADVFDAVALLNEHTISCIPIVTAEGKVAGILTWRDLLKGLEARRKQKSS